MTFLRFVIVIFILYILAYTCSSQATHAAASATNGSSGGHTSSGGHATATYVKLVDWRFSHLKMYMVIALFMFVVIVMKIVYEYLEIVSSIIPESCMLIVVGVITGAIMRYGIHVSQTDTTWNLTPDLFFNVLLPPIILDAAHGLSVRAFADIFGPVMLFAVVATTLNFLIIGFSLYGLNLCGAMGAGAVSIPLLHCLLFGALIVAVDPVAVLAIFEEIGVDKTLYFLVFGESLFNDAVTVVLYKMMTVYVSMTVVKSTDIVLGIVSFFTISLGGALVGIIFGFLSCLLTRCTDHCTILQPSLILVIAYVSYLTGDLFGWSGIISMIACGLLQAIYAFHNMSTKSVLVTRRMIKLLASISEAMVFLYLGIELTRGVLKWDTGFCLWALSLCLITRFIITFSLSAFLNKGKLIIKNISFTDQFIIGYGGLRGAVAFSLATLLDKNVFIKSGIEKEHFLTATLFIIMFTIFPMGITIKPLVKLLKIKLESEAQLSLLDEINGNVLDHFSAGIESISGVKGHNFVREWFENLDSKYVRPLLQNNPEEASQRIVDVYEKVALTLHYANINHNNVSNKHFGQLPTLTQEKYLTDAQEVKDNTYGDHKVQMVHGVDTILSLVDQQDKIPESDRKMSFAQTRFSVNPDINENDYAGLFVNSRIRSNTVGGEHNKGDLPHEEYKNQIHNAFKTKTKYNPNVRRRRQSSIDFDVPTANPPKPGGYQPLTQFETDGRPSDSAVGIEMRGINVRPPFNSQEHVEISDRL